MPALEDGRAKEEWDEATELFVRCVGGLMTDWRFDGRGAGKAVFSGEGGLAN